MYDRDSALKSMDATRSVLERLPEAACHDLYVYCYSENPKIQFFGDAFAAVCGVFPFVEPTRAAHDGKYYAEEFYVDGVRLFHLLETEDEKWA